MQTKHVNLRPLVEFRKRFLLRLAAMIVARTAEKHSCANRLEEDIGVPSLHKKCGLPPSTHPRICSALFLPGIRTGEEVFPIETIVPLFSPNEGTATVSRQKREGRGKSQEEPSKPLLERSVPAVKHQTDGFVAEGMSFSTLAGGEGLEARFPQQQNGITDTEVEISWDQVCCEPSFFRFRIRQVATMLPVATFESVQWASR